MERKKGFRIHAFQPKQMRQDYIELSYVHVNLPILFTRSTTWDQYISCVLWCVNPLKGGRGRSLLLISKYHWKGGHGGKLDIFQQTLQIKKDHHTCNNLFISNKNKNTTHTQIRNHCSNKLTIKHCHLDRQTSLNKLLDYISTAYQTHIKV